MTTLLIQTAILMISAFFASFMYIVGNYFQSIVFAIVSGGMLAVIVLELVRGCGA